MDSFEEFENELERLERVCLELEDQAGLSEIMNRSREGRFFPLGAFGEPFIRREYFAEEYDARREKTRDAYFSVTDENLRKILISACRNVGNFKSRCLKEDILNANRGVIAANIKLQQPPWGKAALVGIGAVALGYLIFGVAGAIAGAVGGFFWGQAIISQARNEASALLAEAKADLERNQKIEADNALVPELFSQGEELSGKRDTNVDEQHAFTNVAQTAGRAEL
ncbi:hypothetical protein [Cupriavidus sp. 8B]